MDRRLPAGRRPVLTSAFVLSLLTLLLPTPTAAYYWERVYVLTPQDGEVIELGFDGRTPELSRDIPVTAAAFRGSIREPYRSPTIALDDALAVVSEEDLCAPVVLPAVAAGAHVITAYAHGAGPSELPLSPASARALRVYLSRVCDTDADCADDEPCTDSFCEPRDDTEPWLGRCRFEPPASDGTCCVGDAWCLHTGHWHGDDEHRFTYRCGDGACVECLVDEDCPLYLDGHVSGACVDGACRYVKDDCACHGDIDCWDDDWCTEDRCDPDSCACVNEPIDGCCLVGADEEPPGPPLYGCRGEDADPCAARDCRYSYALGHNICRVTADAVDCCGTDEDCVDSEQLDPCNDPEDLGHGRCVELGDFPAFPALGRCEYPSRPEGCCLRDSDCSDRYQLYEGTCVAPEPGAAGECDYTPHPDACTPTGSGIVINEIMVSARFDPFCLGDWVELYNPEADTVDLRGWTLEYLRGDGEPARHRFSETTGCIGSGRYMILGREDSSSYCWHGPPYLADLALGGYWGAPGEEWIWLAGELTSCDYEAALQLLMRNSGLHDEAGYVELRDAAGTLVDRVEWDERWPLVPGHSLALVHPELDNGVPESWRSSMTPCASLSGGWPTGGAQWCTAGSPNVDAQALGVPDIVVSGGPCDDGDPYTMDVCSSRRCQHLRARDYCESDSDCDDDWLCTVDSCASETRLCLHELVGGDCCDWNRDCADWYPPGVEDEVAREVFDLCADRVCVMGVCTFERNDDRPGCCIGAHDPALGCSDDNVCAVDECVPDLGVDRWGGRYPRCRLVLDLDDDGVNDCCYSYEDCDDGNPETHDRCQLDPAATGPVPPNRCWHWREGCLCAPWASGDGCDDGDPCTIDACCTGPGEPLETCPDCCGCGHDPIPGCCVSDGNCDDGRACTRDICCAGPGDPSPLCGEASTCVHEGDPARCCETQVDCNGPAKPEEFYCRTGYCLGGVCRYGPQLEGCCVAAEDCGAPTACSSWACVDHICLPRRAEGCCETSEDCLEHPDPCQLNVCEANQCVARAVPNCCVDDNPADRDGTERPDAGCDETPEDDPCTADYCLPGPHGTSVCRHFPAVGPGCCSTAEQCPDDNVQCTTVGCEEHRCVLEPVINCLARSPYRVTFSEGSSVYAGELEGVEDLSWGTDELGTNRAAQFWSLTTDGLLGPDRHLQFRPDQDVTDFEACVVLPNFRTNGMTAASLQFTWASSAGQGSGPALLRVLVRNGGGWLTATELWAQPITDASEPTLQTVPFPATSLDPERLPLAPQLALCASAASSAVMGTIAFDDVVMAEGAPPELDQPENRIVLPGQPRLWPETFRAHSPWAPLRFVPVGGWPPWLRVSEARQTAPGQWVADLQARRAQCPPQGSAYTLTLEARAGGLVTRRSFFIVVEGCR